MSGLDARVRAVRDRFELDLSISIRSGTTAALLGPNGAGKSTAVAALAGLLPLVDGHVALDGRILDDPARGHSIPPEERRIGVVFQDYLLFPHLSVLENVAFGLRSRSEPGARSRAGDWLERLGLSELADRRPPDLSGGQAQRVALARALVTEPDLLLLDEPLAALDVTTRAELRHVLALHLEAFGGPVLLITHDPAEAFLLADEIHVLEDGRVTQTGSADDIRLRPRTPYVADLAGANLFEGLADGGAVRCDGHELRVADHSASGPVLVTISPAAVSVHRVRPEGSPRNVWETAVDRVERVGDRVRLRTGAPLPVTVEITPEANAALDVRVGSRVWVSVKATNIRVEPN